MADVGIRPGLARSVIRAALPDSESANLKLRTVSASSQGTDRNEPADHSPHREHTRHRLLEYGN